MEVKWGPLTVWVLILVVFFLVLKYSLLCSAEKLNSYRFGTTWGWVNDRIFNFKWTIPLNHQLTSPFVFFCPTNKYFYKVRISHHVSRQHTVVAFLNESVCLKKYLSEWMINWVSYKCTMHHNLRTLIKLKAVHTFTLYFVKFFKITPWIHVFFLNSDSSTYIGLILKCVSSTR